MFSLVGVLCTVNSWYIYMYIYLQIMSHIFILPLLPIFPLPRICGVHACTTVLCIFSILHRMCVWAWHSWCKAQPVPTWMCWWAWRMRMGRRQISAWAWFSSSWYESMFTISGAFCAVIVHYVDFACFGEHFPILIQLLVQRTQYTKNLKFSRRSSLVCLATILWMSCVLKCPSPSGPTSWWAHNNN